MLQQKDEAQQEGSRIKNVYHVVWSRGESVNSRGSSSDFMEDLASNGPAVLKLCCHMLSRQGDTIISLLAAAC